MYMIALNLQYVVNNENFRGGAEDRVDFRGEGREGEGDKSSPTEYKRGNIKIDR